MMRFITLLASVALLVLSLPVLAQPAAPQQKKPNIIFILADDIGYGDLGCYGATKVKTPNCDRLASQGLRFSDGHAASATCTPSRYSIMTGQYAWRKKGTGIAPGDAALIIDLDKPTLPGILKSAGYTTGAVGKWHLGLSDSKPDWNAEIKPGPIEVGFDYCFILPATGDRVPCVYLENHRVVGLDPADPIKVSYQGKIGDEPTGAANPDLLKLKLTHGHDMTIVNGISRIGFMSGGKSARWVDEDMADTITGKAVGFIEKSRDKPFFLYFATHDIHVPRVPHARFKGTSGCGTRGDVIQQFDWSVGQILAALEKHGLDKDTLVVLSSDNGPVLDDGYADGAVENLNGHTPAGPLKGGKYSLFEGGSRLPFITRWPGRIKPGVSDALVCQIDFMASFAALAGVTLPDNAGPDSFNVLPALLGDSKMGREHLVEHANGTALRKGAWKYIPAAGPGPKVKAANPNAKGAPAQLYDLSKDLGEATNLIQQHPDVARQMQDQLTQLRDKPQSR